MVCTLLSCFVTYYNILYFKYIQINNYSLTNKFRVTKENKNILSSTK